VLTLQKAVSEFGAKVRLDKAGAKGVPEDQLRPPLEGLIADLALRAGR
jgi:hypothetical protein